MEIRNIAIIAHVDHGKTTLVDKMLRQSGIFRSNQEIRERVMDSNDLERERGITILAKNTSVEYDDYKINIVDTPGHADFGGEVERTLSMVDGVLLLVDAFEGAMPQTRFVLRKALEQKLKPIVVINKIDRPEARPAEVLDEVYELFMELGGDSVSLDFPVVYASARDGYASLSPEDREGDLHPLFETIIKEVPAPKISEGDAFQMLVATIGYDEYLGRIAIGRVVRGSVHPNDQLAVCRPDTASINGKVAQVFTFSGLKRVNIEESTVGDIIAISGIAKINIGDTLCIATEIDPLPPISVDEPTLKMCFSTNNSPFAGRDGDYITSRHLRDRLMKELETNVSLRVDETDTPDSFEVSGRGELHLSILIENMRREGYELQVSKPEVIMREVDGVKHEPVEMLTVDVPDEFTGTAMEKLGIRRGELCNMFPMGDGSVRMEFKIPARGLIGLRSEFLTETRGTGIMHHVFFGYEPYKGEVPQRQQGALIAFETGEATGYGIFNAQERGSMFISPGYEVYEGMIVGQSPKSQDIEVNVCKKKQLTNMRASGSDETMKIVPAIEMTLEAALEFINDDELVEVTPKNIRIRKQYLDANMRRRSGRKA